MCKFTPERVERLKDLFVHGQIIGDILSVMYRMEQLAQIGECNASQEEKEEIEMLGNILQEVSNITNETFQSFLLKKINQIIDDKNEEQ